jgi:glyoxylase-like metal-dependent hydrolase (beta-lactamase superfamily II)
VALSRIADGTWRIESRTGARNMYQYLLADAGEALIVDSGETHTTRESILPALAEAGVGPEQVKLIVITHPDADHQGGLAGLHHALPRARTACGYEDRPLVEDPERLLRDRYGAYQREHALGFSDDERRWVRAHAGAYCEIDVGFVGGERIGLGVRELQVLHAPGHSRGHLMLWEPASRTLIASDAVHGRVCPAADGTPALPPTYEDVDDYLATIERVEQLGAEAMHTCHFPPLESAAAVLDFCATSRAFVDDLDACILGRLKTAPATLAQLCETAGADLGPFGAGAHQLMFVVHGHLRRLLRRALVTADDLGPPVRYRLPG